MIVDEMILRQIVEYIKDYADKNDLYIGEFVSVKKLKIWFKRL
jgi:hypothetical protein